MNATAMRQEIANQPGYIIRGPLCSFVGVLDFKDSVVSPMVTNSRRTNRFLLAGPRACSICGELLAAPTAAELATAWMNHLAAMVRDVKCLERHRALSTLPEAARARLCSRCVSDAGGSTKINAFISRHDFNFLPMVALTIRDRWRCVRVGWLSFCLMVEWHQKGAR